MHAQPVFRFAPSPNGYLHLGHAYSARLNAEWAARTGGRFLLRIEDIDMGRAREEFELQIYDDLDHMGLNWEEPVCRQSEHMETYQEALDRLEEMGLLYPCFASRRDIALADETGATDPEGAALYPGLYRRVSEAKIRALKDAGEPYALRLKMDEALDLAKQLLGEELSYAEMDVTGQIERQPCPAARWGDVILARKDVPTSYHIAVVVDDAAQDISHVMRGRDLVAATDIHRLLQVLLDLPEPAYHHHKLIKRADGQKLSKSQGDVSIKALRDEGQDFSGLTAPELFELGKSL